VKIKEIEDQAIRKLERAGMENVAPFVRAYSKKIQERLGVDWNEYVSGEMDNDRGREIMQMWTAEAVEKGIEMSVGEMCLKFYQLGKAHGRMRENEIIYKAKELLAHEALILAFDEMLSGVKNG
jgi:hypothetical protein